MKKIIITETQANLLNILENTKGARQLDEIVTKIPSDLGGGVELPQINVSYQVGGDIEIELLGEISLTPPNNAVINEEKLQQIGLIIKDGLKDLINEKLGFSEQPQMRRVAQ